MARLIPNPIGDVTQPLARIERSIGKLGDQLGDIEALPRIDEQLADINGGIKAIVEVLGEVHAELRSLNDAVAKRGDLV